MHLRARPPASTALDGLRARIRGEFLEMPGLVLTQAQAERLFGLADSDCARLLDALVHQGFLIRRPDGRYARHGDAGRARSPHSARSAAAVARTA